MPEQESASRVALGKKHHRIVAQAIERWRHSGVVNKQTAARLSDSIAIASFDWQRTARYAFIISIFCLVIAILADRGVDLVSPLPADIQTYIVLATGLSAAATEPEAGKALINFLRSDAATPVIKAKGW